MTPLPYCTIFLSEKAGGLDLVGSAALAGLKKGGIKRGLEHFAVKDPVAISSLSFYLQMLVSARGSIFIHPSIFALIHSPPVSTSLPLFFHLAPVLGCQLSHVESCLSYLLPMYSLHSDLLQYGQERPPAPPCTGIP